MTAMPTNATAATADGNDDDIDNNFDDMWIRRRMNNIIL